ncbi:MAG: hypothetical protein ACRD5H_09080 [Nitrososphaerales archaeon]
MKVKYTEGKKRWWLNLVILSTLMISLLFYGGCEQLGTGPANASSVFDVEYDYMSGCDLFPSGESFALSRFNQCGTSLLVTFDEQNLSATALDFFSIPTFMKNHAQQKQTGGPLFGTQLLGMVDALNPPVPSYFLTGVTFYPDSTYAAYRSAVFVQAIQNLGGNVESMREKTVIHELGHARGLLHSCVKLPAGWVQLTGHDAPGCVMCIGRIDSCSSPVVDVTANPQFCPADCGRLKKVK